MRDRIWNYYRDGVTQSFLNTFDTCRQQCYYGYVEGWTPKTTPFHFMYGHTIHHVLRKIYEDLDGPPNSQEVIDYYINDTEKVLVNNSYEGEFSPKETAFFEKAAGLADILIPWYFRLVAPTDWHDYHFIKTEQTFKVPYKDTFLNGQFDAVLEDGEGDLWIMDHKTNSPVIDETKIVNDLKFDYQIYLYLYAAWKTYDRVPKGLIYNILRRPGERQTKKETRQDYFEKVKIKVIGEPANYFRRIEFRIHPTEITRWLEEQLDPVLKFVKWWNDNDFPRYVAPMGLTTKYGPCSLYDFIVNDNRTNYYRRNIPFMELA